MGLDPKGRAFYWRNPSRSNDPVLKHDEDIPPNLRAFRSPQPISPKPPRSATMRAQETRRPRAMTLEAIRALIQADLHSVDGVIRARLKSAVPLVDQVAEHIISGGGKRLRPLLVVLAGGAIPRTRCSATRRACWSVTSSIHALSR